MSKVSPEFFPNKIIAQYEGYYASVVFAYLSSPGLPLIVEDSSSKGRVDLTIILPDKVYVIEFKVDQPGKALAQIKEKGYHEKYFADSRTVYIIGISFDAKERNITDFDWDIIGGLRSLPRYREKQQNLQRCPWNYQKQKKEAKCVNNGLNMIHL